MIAKEKKTIPVAACAAPLFLGNLDQRESERERESSVIGASNDLDPACKPSFFVVVLDVAVAIALSLSIPLQN